MKWDEKVYAFYSHDENVCDGTIPEIAAYTGKTIETLKWLATPTGRTRFHGTYMVDLVDWDKEIATLKINERAKQELLCAGIRTVYELAHLSDDKLRAIHPNARNIKQSKAYRDYLKKIFEEEVAAERELA